MDIKFYFPPNIRFCEVNAMAMSDMTPIYNRLYYPDNKLYPSQQHPGGHVRVFCAIFADIGF